MKLNYEVAKIKSTRKQNWISLIQEFIDSGAEFAEIQEFEKTHKNIWSTYASINNTIRRKGFPVHMFSKNNRIYLERTDLDV